MIRNNAEALEMLEGVLVVLEDESTNQGDSRLWALIILLRAMQDWLEHASNVQ